MQSLVFGVAFHLSFECSFVGDFAGIVPLLASMIESNVPDFRCRPAVGIECIRHLGVVLDAADVGAAGGWHRYILSYELKFLNIVEHPVLSSRVDWITVSRLHHPPVRHSVPICAVVTLVPHRKVGVFASCLYNIIP